MADTQRSKTVRAGSRTYFIDLQQTSQGKSYLAITESRFKGEDKERERQRITIFPEHVDAVLSALNVMAKELLVAQVGENA